MSKRPLASSSKVVDFTPAKRPHEEPPNNDDDGTNNDDNDFKKLKSFFINEKDEDPAKLVDTTKELLKRQEKVLCYLYPSKKRNPKSKIESLIQESLQSLHDKLDKAKSIKVSVATFGALGKGKSFVLNHVLNYDLDNEDLELLPSGRGASKTPVPIKIKYGPIVKVITRKADKENEVFNGVDDKSSLKEAAICIDELFKSKESLKDVECVSIFAPLPVFKCLAGMVKSSCTYQDIDVEIELVDLPGLGDNHGNALIGKELDVADVILIFKNGECGRQVTAEELKEVFSRRKMFDYANRPCFVVIENDRENTICQMDEEKAREKLTKEATDVDTAWRNLQDEIKESYQVVYDRLPLTTAKYFLEKFQEESKAIVFATKQGSFLEHLGKVISQHVNKVILKKNIHPVMQGINKDAHIIQRRIRDLKKATKHQHSSKLKKLSSPDKHVNFQVSINEYKDKEFVDGLKEDISNLNVSDIPTMLEAHNDLLDLFRHETTMECLLIKLRAAIKEHYKTLLVISGNANGLSLSDASFISFAEMACETLVNKFMAEHARGYIDNCVKRLANKKPSSKVQKWWENDEDQRIILLKEHCDQLVQHLYSLLENGTRKDRLLELLKKLREAIDDRMLWGLEVDENPDINKQQLDFIMTKNKLMTSYSRKKMREVNPHPEHSKDFLDSTMDFPKPLQKSDAHEASSLPSINHDSSLKKVFDLLKKRKEGSFDELRRKLGLTKGSITVPEDKDEFDWTLILLNVLYDPRFHHEKFKGELPDSWKLHVDSISDHDVSTAKQQLFAYQKSTATCKVVVHDSTPSDTIKIKINDNKDGITALVSPDLKKELDSLTSLKDPTNLYIAPIFIPSIHYGPSRDAMGNLFLEEDPWTPKEDDDEDGDGEAAEEQNTGQAQPAGLEGQNATIMVVVEPDHEVRFRKNLQDNPPNVTFRYVVLPQKGRGIGVSRSIIKMLAECLKMPLYWTIDDDIKLIREYNKNSGRWERCTMRRALLYGQSVYLDCLATVVNDLTISQKRACINNMQGLFPDWAEDGAMRAMELVLDAKVHDEVKKNISCLHAQFAESKKRDCQGDHGDQASEQKWLEAEEKCIKEIEKFLLNENFKRIGRVSIGNESGKRNGYYLRCDTHYRKSMQNYQMVLHNAESLKGFNYVSDDVVLKCEEGTVDNPDLRDKPYFGMKHEDKSLCKALEFYGIVGYQVIQVALSNEKLTNAFGRVGNSYQPEPNRSDADELDKKMDCDDED